MDEMFERVRAFIRGEVVAGSAEMVRPSQEDKGYIRSAWTEGLEKARNRGSPREARRNIRVYTPYPRKDTFTPTYQDLKEILAMESGSQHQRLLLVKKANRGSCGLEKVGPSGERYPPNQLKEQKPRKEQCKGIIKGNKVRRILVDGGSSSEIMYEHFFKNLNINIMSKLKRCRASMVDFSREIHHPLGVIDLRVTMGRAGRSKMVLMEFAITKYHSPYNVIIGRTEMRSLRARSPMGMQKARNGARFKERDTILGRYDEEEPHLDVRPTLQRLPFYCAPPAAADDVISNPTPEDLAAGTPNDDDESDDDDACVKISLVTPLRSAAVIPSSGNQDSWDKGIMVDDVDAPSGGDGVARNYEFTREEWDTPYRPTFRILMKEVLKDLTICKTIVDQFPTPGEMVRVEGLSDDQLTTKISVLHCMMMSHGGKILARYRGLNQSHYEYVSGLNDKLATLDASFSKSTAKAKGKEKKKKIKSLSKSLDNLHSEANSKVWSGSFLLLMSLVEFKVNSCLWLPMLDLSVEHVNVVVEGSDLEMADGATPSKSGGVFVHGVSHVLDDVVEATAIESERISSVHTDFVVALSVGGKDDGSVPSSTVEEVVVPPSGV
nr:reverse transcriptase domain-containing protein [Tanacetum cinerariifolium]